MKFAILYFICLIILAVIGLLLRRASKKAALQSGKKRKWIRVIYAIFLTLVILAPIWLMSVNVYVKGSTKEQIVTADKAKDLGADCVLVLGCQVLDSETPSHMLADRVERGIELYRTGAAKKLLMSGDHGRTEYNEVAVMKRLAIDAGVPEDDIFMDHAGFSTYESLYRARDVFAVKKVIIVSQSYHLYRALYVAKRLGLEAVGVASDQRVYSGQSMRERREVLARNKDFFTSIFKPKPKYLGDVIPISGSGKATND